MNTQRGKILFGLYALTGIIIEGVILWLFPRTGLGGLICWPTTIVLSLGLGFFLYRLTKREFKNWQIATILLLLINIQTYLQLSIIPQDVGGDVFSKISNSRKAYSDFDKIQFDDFPFLTTPERVVYIYKFKNRLPNTFTVLTIDSLKNQSESINPRTYLIQNINGERLYDKNKLNILVNDTVTIITEYYHKTDTLIYRMHRNFINTGGGYNDRIISLDVNEDDFNISTGIELSLYKILTWTKEASR